MKHIDLDTSVSAFLTAESVNPKTDKPQGTIVKDAAGNPVRIAQDRITGAVFAKVCSQLPNGDTEKEQAQREAIIALCPVHFSSEVPDFTGYWVSQESHPAFASAIKL